MRLLADQDAALGDSELPPLPNPVLMELAEVSAALRRLEAYRDKLVIFCRNVSADPETARLSPPPPACLIPPSSGPARWRSWPGSSPSRNRLRRPCSAGLTRVASRVCTDGSVRSALPLSPSETGPVMTMINDVKKVLRDTGVEMDADDVIAELIGATSATAAG